MSAHKDSVSIHIPYAWSYADASARTGASGFAAGDVGKFARQEDDNSVWMLTATTPTWKGFGADVVSDTAYDESTWNGDTTHAPSKNAVRDKIEAMSSGGLNDYIFFRDEKTQNTAGGTFTSGAWRTRNITTEVSDTGSHASVASNQITLAAGTYICKISCPSFNTNGHQARLFDVTGNALLALGTSIYQDTGGPYSITKSEIVGKFVLSVPSVVEVQHYAITTRSTDGFGRAANIGTEIYTIAEFWKVG